MISNLQIRLQKELFCLQNASPVFHHYTDVVKYRQILKCVKHWWLIRGNVLTVILVASRAGNTIWKPTGTDRIQTFGKVSEATSIKGRLGEKSNGDNNDENDKYIIKLDKETGKKITSNITCFKNNTSKYDDIVICHKIIFNLTIFQGCIFGY